MSICLISFLAVCKAALLVLSLLQVWCVCLFEKIKCVCVLSFTFCTNLKCMGCPYNSSSLHACVSVCLPVCLPVCLSVSVCMHACLSVRPSACLPVCLPILSLTLCEVSCLGTPLDSYFICIEINIFCLCFCYRMSDCAPYCAVPQLLCCAGLVCSLSLPPPPPPPISQDGHEIIC